MIVERDWRELIIDYIEIVAGLDHLMTLGRHLAHETFQDIGCIDESLLSRRIFW